MDRILQILLSMLLCFTRIDENNHLLVVPCTLLYPVVLFTNVSIEHNFTRFTFHTTTPVKAAVAKFLLANNLCVIAMSTTQDRTAIHRVCVISITYSTRRTRNTNTGI